MHRSVRTASLFRWLPRLLPLPLSLALGCGGDSETGLVTPEESFAACQDGYDNDGDGQADCADPQCQVFLVCASTEAPDASDTLGGDDAAEVGPADGDDGRGQSCVQHSQCAPEAGSFCIEGRCQSVPDYSPGPSAADRAAMGMVEGAGERAEPSQIGAVIDTFCGVAVYQNGPDPLASSGLTSHGWGHQSTELAYRFLCEHYGLGEARGAPYGHAKSWYGNTTDPVLAQLTRIPSGGREPPRPGDVIVFSAGTYGHVAIVKRVLIGDGVGLVEVIEQNVHGGSHFYAMQVDDERYSMSGATGWMRVADAPPACGVAGALTVYEASAQALTITLRAEAAAGIAEVELALDGVVIQTRAGDGQPTLSATEVIAIDAIEDTTLAAGFHELALTVRVVSGGAHEVARTRFEVVVGDTHPLAPIFDEAASESGVPACLLMAIAELESGWDQALRGPAGEVGVMQLDAPGVEQGAALIGVPSTVLGEATLAGARANIRAAAALIASWSDEDLHDAGERPLRLADDPVRALESWWLVVARYDGAGQDGLLTTSNYAQRVYDLIATGRPGRFDPVAIDLEAVPPVRGSRPATPAELAAGEVRVEDQALRPAVPALHIRTFEPFSASALVARHDCTGPCAGEACPECAPRAEVACADGALVWLNGCGIAGALVDACVDDDPCTADGCAEGACSHTPLEDGASCGPDGLTCQAGVCDCVPRVGRTCVGDAVRWLDSCGNLGSVAESCAGEDPCASYGCSGGECVVTPVADETVCGSGLVCRGGTCRELCTDQDGDGFYADCEPFDCPGQDQVAQTYPGAQDLWDARDNDCDGISDALGRVRYDRYFKAWTPTDWEHRWSTEPIPDFEYDGHWIEIYPADVCGGAFAPTDGCFYKNDEKEAEIRDGLVHVALAQCTGRFGATGQGEHISLLLQEDSGEYGDYANPELFPHFTCTRLGFIPGPLAAGEMPSAVRLYRHRSGFGGDNGRADNMWSPVPDEGEPWYDRHDPSFWVLGAE